MKSPRLGRPSLRLLVIEVVADVLGDEPDEVPTTPFEVDARDWQQILGRLEAELDCTLGLLTRQPRVVDVEQLVDRALAIAARGEGGA